jgi:hypothetical protein
MKDGAPHEPAQDMRWDESDPVWRLLAQAPRREPDAWFAARTVALCRDAARSHSRAWVPRLAGLWRWALGGGLAASMAVALVVNQTAQIQPDQVDQQKNVQEAFAIMASIDTDSDSSSSPSSWQDSSL